jgi:hypothetical protein
MQEEFNAAEEDTDSLVLQTWIHDVVRWGIIGVYMSMDTSRVNEGPQ